MHLNLAVQKDKVKKIRGLKPIDETGGGKIQTENIKLGEPDEYSDVELRSVLAGHPILPKEAKSKILGLKPDSGTPDEKKLNRLRPKGK